MPSLEYPKYFIYNDRPVVHIKTADGGMDCLGMRYSTGEFDRMMEYADGRDNRDAWVSEVSRDEFIQCIEATRAEYLKGDGPVFTLYEMIDGLIEVPREQGQRISEESLALIRSLRKKTHELFEADLLAQGRTGTPNEDGSLAVPVPTGPRPIPPSWRYLPAPEVEEIVRRLLVLGEQLRTSDVEATADALGWPVAETTSQGVRLDAGLSLGGSSVWLTSDYGSLLVQVPTSMTVLADVEVGQRFVREAFEAACQACQNVLGNAPRKTGGRWPEWSWGVAGVGIFVRQGTGYVELLGMSEEAAAVRYRAVQEDIEWGE